MLENKYIPCTCSVHSSSAFKRWRSVKSTGKGSCLAICMLKDKCLLCCRGHQGWNVSMVLMVFCPLVGGYIQCLGNWVTWPNLPWPKGVITVWKTLNMVRIIWQRCMSGMVSWWGAAVSEGGLVRVGIQMIDEEYWLQFIGIDESQECDLVWSDSAGCGEKVNATAWTQFSPCFGKECLWLYPVFFFKLLFIYIWYPHFL